MTDSAQLFHGIHDTPVYTDFLFRKPLRLWVAAPAALGLTLTFIFTVRLLDSGHARAVLFTGLALTGLVSGLGAILPTGRPGLGFRAAALWRTVRPAVRRSASDALVGPPEQAIGNLRFTKHGVYADFLVVGLRYYLQSTKRRTGVADRHRDLARELPSGTWIYGLSVPQDERQLLRAMLHGHRERLEWARTCQMLEPILAETGPEPESTGCPSRSTPAAAGTAPSDKPPNSKTGSPAATRKASPPWSPTTALPTTSFRRSQRSSRPPRSLRT